MVTVGNLEDSLGMPKNKMNVASFTSKAILSTCRCNRRRHSIMMHLTWTAWLLSVLEKQDLSVYTCSFWNHILNWEKWVVIIITVNKNHSSYDLNIRANENSKHLFCYWERRLILLIDSVCTQNFLHDTHGNKANFISFFSWHWHQ